LRSDLAPRSVTEKLRAGVQQVSELLFLGKQNLSRNLIGLEINTDYIKLLQISGKDHQQEIDFFSIVPVPPQAIVKDEIKNPAIIAQLLKDTFKKQGITTSNVALSIPRSSAIIKDITVDKRLNEDEIESRVWIEANRFFPNLIGEIYLDFVVIGPSAQDASQLEIILVACRKEQIDPYLEVIRLADLHPRLVDVNSYALERALSVISKQNPENKSLALLNISFSLITLIVIHEGVLIYTHELSYDGHGLLTQKGEKIDSTQSNNILKSGLSLHLRHTMQFFYSSRPNIRIDQLLLSGDCAVALPDMCEFIQKETVKATILADPFKSMKMAKGVDEAKLRQYSPALVLCCGLALSMPIK
jgi:type IV pilus assembly protein PilM